MFEEHVKLHLRLENPKLLTQGRWIKGDYVSTAYLVYKVILGIYFLTSFSILTYLHVEIKRDFAITWIYFTHWGHKLIIISYLLNTVLVVIRYVQEKETRTGTNKKFFETNNVVTEISWALLTMANAVALTITIVYWTVLYDPENQINYSSLQHYDNIDVHLIQTVITLVDLSLIHISEPTRPY